MSKATGAYSVAQTAYKIAQSGQPPTFTPQFGLYCKHNISNRFKKWHVAS